MCYNITVTTPRQVEKGSVSMVILSFLPTGIIAYTFGPIIHPAFNARLVCKIVSNPGISVNTEHSGLNKSLVCGEITPRERKQSLLCHIVFKGIGINMRQNTRKL